MLRVLAIAALGYSLGSPERTPRCPVLGQALAGFHEAVNVALVEGPRAPILPPLPELGLSREIERAVARLPFIVALREVNGR